MLTTVSPRSFAGASFARQYPTDIPPYGSGSLVLMEAISFTVWGYRKRIWELANIISLSPCSVLERGHYDRLSAPGAAYQRRCFRGVTKPLTERSIVVHLQTILSAPESSSAGEAKAGSPKEQPPRALIESPALGPVRKAYCVSGPELVAPAPGRWSCHTPVGA